MMSQPFMPNEKGNNLKTRTADLEKRLHDKTEAFRALKDQEVGVLRELEESKDRLSKLKGAHSVIKENHINAKKQFAEDHKDLDQQDTMKNFFRQDPTKYVTTVNDMQLQGITNVESKWAEMEFLERNPGKAGDSDTKKLKLMIDTLR
jgi:hypothetical protein